jgi:hypothetical protein
MTTFSIAFYEPYLSTVKVERSQAILISFWLLNTHTHTSHLSRKLFKFFSPRRFQSFKETVKVKFGTCTVVSVNGTLVEDKMRIFRMNMHILASTSVPFTLTTVQVTNLALTHAKQITVYMWILCAGYCNIGTVFVLALLLTSFPLLLNTPIILFVGCIYHTIFDRVG